MALGNGNVNGNQLTIQGWLADPGNAEHPEVFGKQYQEEATKDGALIEPRCGALYHITVKLQGLSVETGNTSLRASAHYPQCVDLNDKTLKSLTCQTFATAWGFRPSGQLEIPSSLMCTTGETSPAPVR